MIEYTSKDILRFWSKVSIGNSDQCWEWQAARMPSGYGRFGVGHHQLLAHRVSYEISKGEITDGLLVCHTCDNPCCVNPAHLWLGTKIDNGKDMASKGRQVFQKHPEKAAHGLRNGAYTHPENRPKGEKHGCAKLTEQQVIEARQLMREGMTAYAVSKRLNISYTSAKRIRSRRIWKHIP